MKHSLKNNRNRIGFLYTFAACFVLMISLLNVRVASAWQKDLSEGWNLISLPEQQIITDIETVFGGIKDKILSVWTYKDGRWQLYSPEDHFSDLGAVDAGSAIWLNMSEPCTLYGTGMSPPSTIELSEGWNFVGYNSDTAKPIEEALESIEGKYESVWGYTDGEWKVYTPSEPGLSDLQEFEPTYGYWIKTTESCHLTLDVSIPPTTKNVPQNEGFTITAFTETKITFEGSGSFLDELVIGDILVSIPIPLAPNGFIRKIESIQRDVDIVIVTTSTCSIGDAIQYGSIGGTQALTYDNVDTQSLPQGITVARSETNWQALEIQINYDDHESGLKYHGAITLESDFVFHIDIEGGSPKNIVTTFTGKATGNIKVEAPIAEVEVGYERSFQELAVPFRPVIVWCGYVPVVFFPKLYPVVGVDGTVSLNVEVEMSLSVLTTLGVEYNRDDTNQVRLISDFQPTFTPNVGLNVGADVKVYIGPRLAVYIYGLVGPYMGLNPYVKYSISHDLLNLDTQETNDANLELTRSIWGGLEMVYGFNANPALFGDDYHLEEQKLPWSAEIKLWDSEGSTANIYGKVVDANNSPLSNVSVVAIKPLVPFGYDEYSTFTNAQGEYIIEDVPKGFYSELLFEKSDYEQFSKYNLIVGEDYNVDLVVLNRVGDYGTFGGVITDALSGVAVPYVNLEFRKGWWASTYLNAPVKILTTSADGSYLWENAEAGYYTVTAKKSGYAENTLIATCYANESRGDQNGSIAPLISNSQLRIVLSWGASPSDLDSHLTGPIEGSDDRFHVYYAARGSETSTPFAVLDRDDVTSYGPETITIYEQKDGLYRYSVHNYSNRGSSSSSALYNSGAQVSVFIGSNHYKTFNVSNALNSAGTLWTIFEYDSTTGSFTDINTMSYESSPSNVSTISHTDSQLMQNLPKKDIGE